MADNRDIQVNTTDEIILSVWVNDDGNQITSFIPNPNYKKSKSWWATIKEWFTTGKASVYISSKDLNNTEEDPYVNKPKKTVEVGIKVKF